MAKDKILTKLEEHDKQFAKVFRRIDDHDRQFKEIRQEISEFRREFHDFCTAVMEALDHLVTNSNRYDQERLVSIHRTDELEKDVQFLETKTGFAREK